jgi:catechol 2,3-dioxygenase-like lactoylglutathione lyase family enzyme
VPTRNQSAPLTYQRCMGLRRRLLAGVSYALFGGILAIAAEAEVSGEPRPFIEAVVAVELNVADATRSRAFFEQLGFVFVRESELSGGQLQAQSGLTRGRARRVELALGNERIALLQFLTPTDGRSVPPDSRGNDLWFQHIAIVVRDMDRAYRWLRAQRVPHISSAPQKLPAWNRAAAGIRAFYFADPDGHTLELIDFPKGKGDPRWQAAGRCSRTPEELCQFLGIDHTAITVSDTDQSLAFYRDQLGLRVAGESENYGVEQEHLNGVFGAHLRITALRAAQGPGIELLEYLSPRGGRPAPADTRPHDLFRWHIVVRTSSSEATSGLLHDRDGHALRVITR